MKILSKDDIQAVIQEGVVKHSGLSIPKRRQAIDRDIAQAQLEDTLRQVVEKLDKDFKVYDTYIKELEAENGALVGFAYTHGWRSSKVELGKRLRSKIKALKSAWQELKKQGE